MSGLMRAYWFFVVYVSPILLVLFCGYLAWRAYRDSRRERSEETETTPPALAVGDSEAEREPWAEDPDAWKRNG